MALVAAALVGFLAVAALVGFDGLPFGLGESEADPVPMADPPAGEAEAAATSAGRGDGARPADGGGGGSGGSGGDGASDADRRPDRGETTPAPGVGSPQGTRGGGGQGAGEAPGSHAEAQPPDGSGSRGDSSRGGSSGTSHEEDGAARGTVDAVEETAGKLGVDVPLDEATDEVTGQVDEAVGKVTDPVGEVTDGIDAGGAAAEQVGGTVGDTLKRTGDLAGEPELGDGVDAKVDEATDGLLGG